MIVGYRAGAGLLHRAHPYTPLTIAASTAVMAFTLPAPAGPLVLVGLLVTLALLARVPAVLLTAVVVAGPFWFFLVVIHVVVGDDPGRAVTVGSRITAMLVAFLLVLATVHPARLVDALLERRWSFQSAYLLSATLQAVPRLRDRGRGILEAQRCRGLRVRDSVWHRVRALVPLAIPLVLSSLMEVDARALALEARAAHGPQPRTPLDPPADHWFGRAARAVLLLAAAAAFAWRVWP